MGCGASQQKKAASPGASKDAKKSAASPSDGKPSGGSDAPSGETQLFSGEVNARKDIPSEEELTTPREERPKSVKIFEEIDALLKEEVDAARFADLTKKVLNGDLQVEVAPKKRMVRLFTSSTFTDTKHERDFLMSDVYPFVTEVCRRLGFEFQIIDMRWGVRESTTDDHSTTALCMSEIDSCRRQSAGPAFFAMLCDKSGYRPFPARIEKPELDKMRAWLVDNHPDDPAIPLIDEWYQLDENAVPAEYRLKPKIDENVGKRNWWSDIFVPMQLALRKASVGADLPPHRQLAFTMAITEEENHRGVLDNESALEQAVIFRRSITGLRQRVLELEGQYPEKAAALLTLLDKEADDTIKEDVSKLDRENLGGSRWALSSLSEKVVAAKDKYSADAVDLANVMLEFGNVGKYVDCEYEKDGNVKLDKGAVELLDSLKGTKIETSRLRNETVRNYEVQWRASGIDPERHQDHREHILRVAEDFVDIVVDSVKKGFSREHRPDDADFEEIAQHLNFMKRKVSSFVGREDVLAKVAEYTDEESVDEPLLVTGYSGSGKTSVLAKAASLVKAKTPNAVLVMRFLGTTPGSGTPAALMHSVVRQVYRAYDMNDEANETPQAYSDLIPEFESCMENASADKPLYIFLDSLDQLKSDGGRKLDFQWIPTSLPTNVHLIMSVIPGVGGYTEFLSEELNSDPYEVPKLPRSDGEAVLSSMLANASPPRTLSSDQRALVLKQFEQCPSPLFLDLAVNLAKNWRSFEDVSSLSLDTTVRAVVDDMYQRLERKHGRLLVSHGLALITAAKNGMSLTELQDIISCDDEVLNDVFEWWTPPRRRLPPSLWVRVRADIGPYLIERGADEVSVYAWYHRQFWEAAEARYLATDEDKKRTHRHIADYFQAKWAGKPKPYTNKKGENHEADRFVIEQPVMLHGKVTNYRKVSELPYHLEKLEAWSELYDYVIDLDIYDEDFDCEQDVIRRLWKIVEKNYKPVDEGFLSAEPTVDNIDSLTALCSLLHDWDRHDTAFKLQEKVVDLTKQEFGEDSVKYAEACMQLACVTADLEDEEENTERLFQTALTIYEKQEGGKDSVDYVACEGNYADFLSEQDKEGLLKAIQIRERQLEVESEALGEEDGQTNATRGNLGSLYLENKQFEEARECMERAIELEILAYGPTHSEVAKSHHNLVVLYEKWRNADMADVAMEHGVLAAGALKETYGADHTNYIDLLSCVRDMVTALDYEPDDDAPPKFKEIFQEIKDRADDLNELDIGEDEDEDGDEDEDEAGDDE